MVKKILVPLVAALLLSTLPGRAQAQSREREAKVLFGEGVKAIEEGNYVDALQLFRSSYERFPNPKVLINIGTCLRSLGRYSEALDTYEQYLRDPKADPKRRPEVEKAIAEVSPRVGKIRIDVTEPGARVVVDGKYIGESPQALTLRVDPGAHTIIAEKKGYSAATATVTVGEGEERVVELRIVASGAPGPGPGPGPAAAGESGPIGPTVPADPPDPPETGASTTVTKAARPRAGGLGVMVRGDVDVAAPGGVAAVGLAYGLLGGRLEVIGAGLVGGAYGAWIGGRLLLGSRALRPTFTLGVPIVFEDGTHPGVQASVGAQWSASARVGVFLDLGLISFPGVAENELLFVPSVGVKLAL